MTISESLILFTVACILQAVPFAWTIYSDLKSNPVSVDEVV